MLVSQAMIKAGRDRTDISRLVHWIRPTFRRGVENEYFSLQRIYESSR